MKMNINQAIAMIHDIYMVQIATGERFAIELVSGPGIGKSSAVRQAAEKIAKTLGKPVTMKDFFLTTVEPPDVRGFGLPSKDEKGNLTMQFTRAPWMPKHDAPEHGILLLDEFGQAQPDVAKPSAELWLHGRVGDSELPITYMVIGASNRESDRSGVNRSLAFIENRKMKIEIQPDLDSWVDWAERVENNIHPLAIAYAKHQPGDVFQESVPDKPGPFCTPRTLCKVSHLIGKLDHSQMFAAAVGYLGTAVGTKLMAFLKVADRLPSFEDIVNNPAKALLPDSPDVQFAATQMLVHRVTQETARQAFTYLGRMGKEFQISGLKSALKRTPALLNHPDFAVWLRENKDLIMSVSQLDKK